jgi:FtsZ-binding cell division protein ZapB
VTKALGEDRKKLNDLQIENDNLKNKNEIMSQQSDKYKRECDDLTKEAR